MTDRYKPLLNIGCGLDIPTGFFVKGLRGDSILLGGLAQFTAVVSAGNAFKSTFMHHMMLTAAARMDYGGQDAIMSTYDTEMNIFTDRLVELSHSHQMFQDRNLLDEGKWIVTDKKQCALDEWYQIYKEFISEKAATKEKEYIDTPFPSYNNKDNIRVLPVSFTEIDSLSKAETRHATNTRDTIELGSSDGNLQHARQGLLKHNLLMDLPDRAAMGQDYILMTGHYKNDSMTMQGGPGSPMPTKKLQFMKPGERISGVPGSFFYLLNNCWHITTVSLLNNKDTRSAMYPLDPKDLREDNDLNIITIKNLRGKAGPSGVPQDIMVSQRDGILPSMTEYYYIKEKADKFGIGGNNIHFHLEIKPDVNLTRTTIRQKLANDPSLERAMNITSELAQMHFYHRDLGDHLCDAKTLFEDIKAQGYDWDELLATTRGWYTFPNNYDTAIKPLSIMDLLNMRKGLYKPYWMQ